MFNKIRINPLKRIKLYINNVVILLKKIISEGEEG